MKNPNKKSYNNSVEAYNREDLLPREREVIKKYFKGKKVLDLGCAVGRTTINISKMGYDVVGIDYAKNLIDKAKEKYPKIKFEVMDASNLKYKDNSFDVVFFSYNGLDSLSPYKLRVKAIKEAHRVLKKGGIFIYTTHKRFYFRFPLKFRYPFIKIHYLRSMFRSLFAFDNYRFEKHPFGKILVYCKNDCSKEVTDNKFKLIKVIDNRADNYYICKK